MKIHYTARHAKISPELKKYSERRMHSLEKMLGPALQADILLSVEKYRHKVEINLKTREASFNAVEETQDMFSSLATAFDRVERRVKKEREKQREKRRRSREPEAPILSPEPESRAKKIIRTQSYSMKPMSVEEAVAQLESSREDAFLFRMTGSENWAVVFKRRDGHYGLVESV